jgi:hypothetical protein
MAEWSMAVVLKTSPIGYTKTVIVQRREMALTTQNLARIRAM